MYYREAGMKMLRRRRAAGGGGGLARFAEIPAPWNPSNVMPESRVAIFQVITLAGRPGEWTKRETGQRVTYCSCAFLPRLM